MHDTPYSILSSYSTHPPPSPRAHPCRDILSVFYSIYNETRDINVSGGAQSYDAIVRAV